MSNPIAQEEQIKYSKILSSLFCSTSIVALSVLSLLNNLSLDVYSMFSLLKTVLPAAICFWIIGFVIGKILDGKHEVVVKEQIKQETEAYEIPSMFGASESVMDDDFGVI
ncbi:hypothetical protein IJX73_02690 [bacterium]|nr:hypothetical protein [bacterium]MBQ9149817.1 hypothetical protein [bacterium]